MHARSRERNRTPSFERLTANKVFPRARKGAEYGPDGRVSRGPSIIRSTRKECPDPREDHHG